MTVASEQNATTGRPVDRAGGGEHAAVVDLGDGAHRAGVEAARPAGAAGCAGPPRGAASGLARRRGVGGADGAVGAVVMGAPWGLRIRRCGTRGPRCGRRTRTSCSARPTGPPGSSRRVVATSRPTSSGSSRLIVGGTTRWCSARTVATDSSAPAAPRRWPVIDLVEVTTTRSASAPSAWRIARASATSPCGVDVAWALMCTMSRRRQAGLAQRDLHRPGGAAALPGRAGRCRGSRR